MVGIITTNPIEYFMTIAQSIRKHYLTGKMRKTENVYFFGFIPFLINTILIYHYTTQKSRIQRKIIALHMLAMQLGHPSVTLPKKYTFSNNEKKSSTAAMKMAHS